MPAESGIHIQVSVSPLFFLSFDSPYTQRSSCPTPFVAGEVSSVVHVIMCVCTWEEINNDFQLSIVSIGTVTTSKPRSAYKVSHSTLKVVSGIRGQG